MVSSDQSSYSSTQRPGPGVLQGRGNSSGSMSSNPSSNTVPTSTSIIGNRRAVFTSIAASKPDRYAMHNPTPPNTGPVTSDQPTSASSLRSLSFRGAGQATSAHVYTAQGDSTSPSETRKYPSEIDSSSNPQTTGQDDAPSTQAYFNLLSSAKTAQEVSGIEQTLEFFSWRNRESSRGLEKQILQELQLVERSTVTAMLEPDSNKEHSFIDALDLGIAECLDLENKLAFYKTQLKSLEDDLSSIDLDSAGRGTRTKATLAKGGSKVASEATLSSSTHSSRSSATARVRT
ncbi:uncharacterized protein V1516DRAFT_680974 [Lipomyces oligophaga]|uniref:uncharacterized protein n=1 Tax=Lipomyces oligophaga TaxID=45792 RepID=UPI0034CF0C37